MDILPRQTLITLIAEHGVALINDPRRVEAYLRDLCGVYKREIFVLVNALKCGLADDLRASPGIPREILLPRLARRLEDEMALLDEVAWWVAETWLLAFDTFTEIPAIDTPALIPPPPPSSVPPIPMAPILVPVPRLASNNITTLEGMAFCYIPAGPFMMGNGEREPFSNPIHPVDIPYGYWLGRYPVTVGQWRAFVETEHKPENRGGLKSPPNYPIRWVTWKEAVSFCRWLTNTWQNAGILPKGWIVRLPGEAEWEKGARGGLKIPKTPVIEVLSGTDIKKAENIQDWETNPLPQRRYPWGDTPDPNRANYHDTGIGNISAVDHFPDGAGPYGCVDMVGNIWEWCSTIYNEQSYPFRIQNEWAQSYLNKEINRSVRGGAFDRNGYDDWCAFRGHEHPDRKCMDLGFRVAVFSV